MVRLLQPRHQRGARGRPSRDVVPSKEHDDRLRMIKERGRWVVLAGWQY